MICRSQGRKLDGLRSRGRLCHAEMKASWAMSSLLATSRVMASATAVTAFWLAATMRP